MERIKDLSKVILRGDGVLAKLVEKKTKSGIILLDSTEQTSDMADYIEVIAVGNKVDHIKPGYIILDVGGKVETFIVNEDRLAMLYSGTITLAVTPDNIDLDKEKDVSTGSINV